MSSNDDSMKKVLSEITYKLGRKIGEGMFSTVKIAEHSLTNEQVAIKILEKTKISSLEDKERINREIAVLKRVNHLNIVKLYQVVETKFVVYLIQEYIQGKEFLEYLTKKGKLKESDACKYFHQIISGLDYLHQCGIAHRDFKPENIILTNNNQLLKIIDFGLSNMYKKGKLLKTSCGSPCYVPPEMVKEQSYNGALSDIWSAGVILYLMLCGKLPFYDDDNEILYEKILSGKYEEPEYLSKDVKDILKKIFEIDPKKRINFEGIKSHPWFSLIDKKYGMHKGININEDIIPVDEEILEKMEKMGLNNKLEIRYNLIKNYHNKMTTIYNLLLKQKIGKYQKSVSDMESSKYEEYINDKKNKIESYGNLENVLKNRIGDDQKIVNSVPNWPENKYDDNNEKIIVGESGSIMERLIKKGRFAYDEENMCLNRVISNKISNLKDSYNDNDGDSRFKTISSFQFKKTENKYRKTTDYDGDKQLPKKNKVHFLADDDNDIKPVNIKKSNLKKEKEEDQDWFKEMENMIDKENEKVLRGNKTSNLHKQKKVKIQNMPLDLEDIDFDDDNKKKKKTLSLSSRVSKAQLKKVNDKKAKFVNNTVQNESNKKVNKISSKSEKTLKKDRKKSFNDSDDFNDYKYGKESKSSKTAKINKTIKIMKNTEENKPKSGKRRERSTEKNEKRDNKFKKIKVDKVDERKRNQSAQKRKLKIKI